MGFFKKTPEEKKIKELTGGFLLSTTFMDTLREKELSNKQGIEIQNILKREVKQSTLFLDQIEYRLNELLNQYVEPNDSNILDHKETVDNDSRDIEISPNFCSNCGTKISKKENKFCSNCGNELKSKNKKITVEINVETDSTLNIENEEDSIDKITFDEKNPKLKIITHKNSPDIDHYFHEIDPKSPNNRYRLKCLYPHIIYDESNEQNIKRYGEFRLYENNKLILSGEMEKPDRGTLADDGSFAIMDNLIERLDKYLFYVFDNEGNLLLKKTSDAFITYTYISANGKYAAFRTSNNWSSECGGKLFFFNLVTKELLFKTFFDNKWPENIDIDETNETITIYYDKNHSYRYDLKGIFIDENKWNIEKYGLIDDKNYLEN